MAVKALCKSQSSAGQTLVVIMAHLLDAFMAGCKGTM